MNKILVSLLVGSHFVPPAKTLLLHLPAGTPLTLEPNPDNAYDPQAVQVMLDPKNIPESQYKELGAMLPMQGATLEQVLSGGPVMLGHIAKTGGNPLAKARQVFGMPELVGNAEMLDWLADPDHQARLAFAASTEPLVELLIEEEQEEQEEEEEDFDSND